MSMARPLVFGEGPQLRLGHGVEALYGVHGLRQVVFHRQRLYLIHGSRAAVHRVYDVLFHGLHVCVRQFALQDVDAGRFYGGALSPGNNLYALGGGVGPLVVLSRQILHGEHRAVRLGHGVIHVVQLGLGKHRLHGVVKQLSVEIFHVVAVEDAHVFSPATFRKSARRPGAFSPPPQIPAFFQHRPGKPYSAPRSFIAFSARAPMSFL
jgi:hypothetical protein